MIIASLSAIGYVGVFLAASYGVGSGILRLGRFPFSCRLQETLFALGTGHLLLSYVLLTAGLAGWLSVEVCWAVLVLALVGSCRRVATSIRAWRGSGLSSKCGPFAWVLLALLGVHALLNLSGALAPPTMSDVLRQHLAAPKYYASVGGFPFIPLAAWNMSGALHVLYTQALLLCNEIAPAVMHWSLGVLTALAIYVLGKEFLINPLAGLVGAVIFYTLPMTTVLSSAAMVELGPNLLVLLALMAILSAKRNVEIRWILLAGILAGGAGASKQWALMAGPAGVAVICALHRGSVRENWRTTLRACLIFGVGFAALISPWFVRNYVAAGDPLWPLLHKWLDVRYIAEWQYLKMSSWNSGPGKSLVDYILGPWNLVNNTAAFTGGRGVLTPAMLSPFLLIFIPIAAVRSWRDGPTTSRVLLALGVFSLVVYTIWFCGYQRPRYLQVAHPILALLAAYGFVGVLSQSSKSLKALCYGALGLSLAVMLSIGVVVNKGAISLLVGAQSEEEYLHDQVPFYRSIAWVNENTPDDACVLVMGMTGWFYLDREFYAGRSQRQGYIPYHEMSGPAELSKRLLTLGITHVLVHSSQDAALFSNLVGSSPYQLEDTDAYLDWLAVRPDASDRSYYEFQPYVMFACLEQQGRLQLLNQGADTIVVSRTMGAREAGSYAMYALQ